MKRTNLVLDEQLLEEAARVLGEKTYSATVNRALQDAVRTKRIQNLGSYSVSTCGKAISRRCDKTILNDSLVDRLSHSSDRNPESSAGLAP